MKIVYLHQYFFTRNMIGVAGTRSYEFARRLVTMGHHVDMVTSYTYTDKNANRKWFQTDEDGIRVHWLPVPYSNKMDFRDRIRAFVHFAVGASRKAASLQADVVLATSGPLTIAVPGLYASWRRRIPLVFEVRDLWPEGAIQLGVLTNPFAKWLARRFEYFVYHRSSQIIALSPGMLDGIIQSGISPEKVTVVPNAADLDLFNPSVDGRRMREKYKLDGRFSLGYFGTMGLANGLGFVLNAAAVLKQRQIDDIIFILHGDGMERSMLEAKAAQLSLDNVIFANPTPNKTEVAELAAAVDVCMTIYKNVPVLRTCSPNKMFDALAAGKPILTNMPGWLGDIAQQDGTGVLVEPDNALDFADKVIWMRDHPGDLSTFGKNARRLAENRFSRDLLAKQIESVLATAVKGMRL